MSHRSRPARRIKRKLRMHVVFVEIRKFGQFLRLLKLYLKVFMIKYPQNNIIHIVTNVANLTLVKQTCYNSQ